MSRHWRTLAVGLGSLLASTCASADQPDREEAIAAGRTALVGAHVIPMTEAAVLENHTVLIEGERIVAVGPAAATPVPTGTKRISAEGLYLIPGLVDAHVHLVGRGAKRDLRLYPVHGITTVVNMRGEPAHLEWREAIARGELFGPNVYTAGPFVESAESTTEVERIVDEHRRSGYDLIKVRGDLSSDFLRALARRARAEGMPVVGHVSPRAGVSGAVGSGQRTIEHAEGLLQTFFGMELDSSRIGVLAERLARSGVCVTPTLVVYGYVVRQTEEYPALARLLARPELAYVDPELVRWWRPERNGYVTRWRGNEAEVPAALERFRREHAFLARITRGLRDAGVPLLAGTDASVAFVLPGFSLHEELRLLHAAGLTPFEVLRAATADPARCLDRSDEFGTIEVGRRADLVLLDENPLERLGGLSDPAGVMVRGRWFDRSELRPRLPR